MSRHRSNAGSAEETSIELEDLNGLTNQEWALRGWPRLTPAQQHASDTQATGVEFNNIVSGHVTGSHRPSGSSVPTADTRKSRGSVTAQYSLLDFIPDIFGGGKRQRSPSSDLAPHQKDRKVDEETLEKVRRFIAYKKGKMNWRRTFFCCFPFRESGPRRPENEELIAVVKRAFPPRMDLPVLVCDIMKEGGNAPFTARVGDIEKLWQEKPADVLIRWIHAPLGIGFLHSSVEDMFRFYRPTTRCFKNAGNPSFPFLEVDSLHFRDREELQHQRNVLRDLAPLDDLNEILTKEIFANDKNESLKADFKWRVEDNFGDKPDFWALARSDFPLELSERVVSTDDGPLRAESFGQGPMDGSIIGKKVAQFEGAQLVVTPFRFFHRDDGVLLTMSGATGIDALHRDFHKQLRDPLESRLQNKIAWSVKHQMDAFAKSGAERWREYTMEYFVARLAAEIGVGPQNFNSGHSAISLLSALQNTVRYLNQRRYDPWDGQKTIALVREHLVCIDQLKSISITFGRRISFFKGLLKDLEEFEAEDRAKDRQPQVINEDGDHAQDKVKWALKVCEDDKTTVELLLDDITRSLDTLHQLQSLQQTEHQEASHKTNKALAIITCVTLIFLPLEFFSSYFGMNVEGIRDTTRTQTYFWKVYGTITLVIVVVVMSCAYWHHVVLDMFDRSAERLQQSRARRRRSPQKAKILP